MNSPLGKYAQLVAAITAVMVIGAYVAGILFELSAAPTLKDFALIALGAVFGSSAATNGWKAVNVDTRNQIAALHRRLDTAGAPAARTDLSDTNIGN